MTERSVGALPLLRIGLAGVVALDLLSYYAYVGEARTIALASRVPLGGFSEILSRPVVRGAAVLVGLAAAASFARRPGRLWEGLVALGALAILSTAHTQIFGSPWRHLFFSGLCLAGWLLGLIVGRYEGLPTDESYARTGSIALLGAAYLSSGISKIVYGGLAWTSGLPVQSSIVGQSGLIGEGLAGRYRFWVATTPGLASIFSTATVAFELCGPLMLVGQKTRLFVALGLIGMHANIYLLTEHILYWESMLLLALYGLSADPTPDGAAVEASSSPARTVPFVASVAVLAAGALLAVGHQVRRHALLSAPVEQNLAPPPTPALTSYRRIGPFTVGQSLAAAWTIDLLELRDDGFMVRVKNEQGQARFDVTCASQAIGSFDVGAAHILYSRDMELSQLEPAGRAIQAEFRRATEGRDVCEQLRGWRTAAQAGGAG